MDPKEKIESIVELTSGRQMVRVHVKSAFLFTLKLLCYLMTGVYGFAAIRMFRFDLVDLADSFGDPELADAVMDLPHRLHADFASFTSIAALFLLVLAVTALIQGRVINSLNKSNKRLMRISSIARK